MSSSQIPARPAGAPFGVVYVAFGPPYLAMAMTSALSLRTTQPHVPITLVTNVRTSAFNVPWWTDGDMWVHLDEPDAANRHVKTRINELSPYQRTLYLDADTLVVGDLGLIDFELQHFDVLAYPSLTRTYGKHGGPRLLGSAWHLSDSVLCNGGVIGFNDSPNSADFFRRWNSHFVELGLRIDQPALAHALHTSRAQYFPLPNRFTTTDSTGTVDATVSILHYKRVGDRATRSLVRRVARTLFNDSNLTPQALRDAMRPKSRAKRWRLHTVRARNRDLVRRSVAEDIRLAAIAAGWL